MGEVERRERWTLHRCPDCDWVTVGGSIHGCVSCLTKREPEPFDVVSAEDLAAAEKAGDALADAVSDIMVDDPESVLHTWARRWREATRHSGDEEET